MKEQRHWFGVYAVLIISTCASLWLNQQSIEKYWQQQYHRMSPLAGLQTQSWWLSGNIVREQLKTSYRRVEDNVFSWRDDLLMLLPPIKVTSKPTAVTNRALTIAQVDITKALAALDDYAQQQAKQQIQQRHNNQHKTTQLPTTASTFVTASLKKTQNQKENKPTVRRGNRKITLKSGDNVMFIGDSMMQSFAPKMQKWLKKQHNINSINMGRHSTGLTNQNYFDWPKKAEASIKVKKNLKLVVVFLGANDAWNMKVSQKVLRFKSPQWVSAYSERMMRIVRAAQAKNAQVIWIGLPYMRSKKYSKKMVSLDNVMRQALKGKAIYIPIRNLLGGKKQQYRDSLKINGKWRRVRHKDGIHLNTQGELKVLEAIKPYIQFK